MLYSIEIERILSTNIHTRMNFRGVFALDTLPSSVRNGIVYPMSFVVNTDPINKAGAHWLALYAVNDERCEYFDSYGWAPWQRQIIDFMLRLSDNIFYNGRRLQSLMETTCGEHCISYIRARDGGHSMHEYLNMFHYVAESGVNDYAVKQYVHNYMD